MKAIINQLIQHQLLSKEQAKQVIINMADGQYTPSQMAAFLTVFMLRCISLEVLEGFREALLELCIQVDLSEFESIDLCGTGGDEKNTFNISTLSAFVTAGAGVKVTKHGNYGVSSACGSSNVLEYLGIKFSNDKDYLERAIDKVGICILHAPLFHPAMKNVAPIRRDLGVKTFFNMLGPMVNPAFPPNQMVGVFNLELARLYSYLYQKTDKNFSIVHALDGYDEISLTGNAKVISRGDEKIINATNFDLNPLQMSQIAGGNTIENAAKIFLSVLEDESTDAQKQVVCANAALAIKTVKNIDLKEAYQQAQESIESGNALAVFNKLQEIN